MKKLNEKAFKILKVLVLFSVIIACGMYYVLFVDEDLAKGMEVTEVVVKQEVTETTKLIIAPKEAGTIVDGENVDDAEGEEFIIEIEPITEDISTISIITDQESTVEEATISQEGIVNINIASNEELQTLKNIGPVVASNIISYRQENGSFDNIEEIKNVKGIGDAKFALIKDFICVK